MDISPFSRRAAEIFLVFLGHVTLQAHLIQRPLIFTGHGLHDGCKEGLGVEESSQPDACRHVEICNPVFQLADSEEKISIPHRETIE